MLALTDNQSKLLGPPTRKCLQHTWLTQVPPWRGGGKRRDELIYEEAHGALQRTQRAVCGCVGGEKAEEKRGSCSKPPIVLGWESCVTGQEKKRRKVTKSLCVCLSSWMSKRDDENPLDQAASLDEELKGLLLGEIDALCNQSLWNKEN